MSNTAHRAHSGSAGLARYRLAILGLFVWIHGVTHAQAVIGSYAINVLDRTGFVRIGSSFYLNEAFSAVGGDLPALGLVNPALLTHGEGVSLISEASWRPRSDFLGLLWIDNVATAPRLLALTFPVSSIRIQLGYARTHEDRRVTDPVLLTTPDNPEGTGTFVTFTTTTTVEGLYVASSYGIDEAWSAGLTVGADVVTLESGSTGKARSYTGNRMAFVGGVHFTPSSRLSAGATAQFTTSSNLDPEQPPQIYRPQSGDPRRPERIAIFSPLYQAISPTRLTLAVAYSPLPELILTAAPEFVKWSDMWLGASDRWNVHVGLSWIVLSGLSISSGFSSVPHHYETYRDYHDQKTLSIAVRCDVSDQICVSVSWTSSEPLAKHDVLTNLDTSTRGLFQTTIAGGLKIGL